MPSKAYKEKNNYMNIFIVNRTNLFKEIDNYTRSYENENW